MERYVDERDVNDIPTPWFMRTFTALEVWARPMWGWGVLFTCMLLALLPAVSLRANRLLSLGDYQAALEVTGPLAVATVWCLWGWREQNRPRLGWAAALISLLCGMLFISELLLGWIPGPQMLWRGVLTGAWAEIPAEVAGTWMRAATRFALWREGVAAGGAAQDNLVFATIASVILWLLGTVTAWLARRVRQGFAASAPSLWLLSMIMLYTSEGRFLLLSALACAVALHILLDQAVLIRRWQQLGLDYSPGLLLDRLLTVLSAGALIFTLAAVMPNLYIAPLVNRYYEVIAPVHLALEESGERLFPALQGSSRLRGGGSGMPNEFLLRGGPNLGSAVVMRVRTNEAPALEFPFEEMALPPAHYMRGRTLAVYDGRGWSNFGALEYEQVEANQRWQEAQVWGRKEVVQSIIFEASTNVLFGAAEPVEASASVRLERRADNDLAAVLANEPSYTIVSMVPAVSERMLRELPAWSTPGAGDAASGGGDLSLPAEMAVHLEVPDAVTERTRELAAELVAGRESAYDRALAIEQYLRQYTYDLDVPEPPDDVTEIADYFLFELQRGYCDYYATAFVVMARLAGLPTRFATGYTYGQWNPVDGVFVISEGDAHSWPEVYFPEAGWIPFEPTAGRAQLTRTALPESPTGSQAAPLPLPAPVEHEESGWNWQLAIWLLPLAALVLLVMRGVAWWQRRREDPWQAVLQWGRGVGRPIDEGETVLEYGQGLAGYVMSRQRSAQDAGRVVAREIQALSEEVNRLRYAPTDERALARTSLDAHWQRLRNYLRLVRIR